MADEQAATAPTQLVAGGLLLRPYRPEDVSALYTAVRESVASIGRWLPWCHDGYSETDAGAWIAHCSEAWSKGDHYTFAIFGAESQRFLGAVGINHRNPEHNFASIGYWVRESARGQGIAARAGRLVVKFGFDAAKLTRIEIVAAVDNLASRRTAENIGARFEGIACNRLSTPLGIVDAAMYALTPSDYAEAQIRAMSS
jgi:RimJ/RimL family protein N-acetyltransferase